MKPNVLIVDDDSIVHLLYGRYLAQVGYEVLTAKNRQEAIAIVSRETVQLIVMDIMMPGGDGLTVLRELKSAEVGQCRKLQNSHAGVHELGSGEFPAETAPPSAVAGRGEPVGSTSSPTHQVRSPTPGARKFEQRLS